MTDALHTEIERLTAQLEEKQRALAKQQAQREAEIRDRIIDIISRDDAESLDVLRAQAERELDQEAEARRERARRAAATRRRRAAEASAAEASAAETSIAEPTHEPDDGSEMFSDSVYDSGGLNGHEGSWG